MTYYDELYQHTLALQEEIDRNTKELQYMKDFLTWRDLWNDFICFRMNAHLEQDEDEPFPRYVL
ncbi:MAG: hypothetical protein IJJ01_04045 [Firmicutes bacterium]|nr:hypothetical protein [Bacillota bacterium]